MGSTESRSIVCSVTSHSNYLILILQGLNQTFLVHRTSTRDNLQVKNALQKVRIRQCRKLRTSNDVTLRILRIIPKTYLTCYFLCCSRSITCYNLHAYTCIHAFLNSCRHIQSYRVSDGSNSDEAELVCYNLIAINSFFAIIQNLVGEAKCTHSTILIFCQLLINILFAYRCFFAKTEHYLRSAFHIKHLLALQSYRLYYGCHILAFCREWHLRNSLYTLTYRAIIYTLIVRPKKKCPFRRVA